MLARSSRVSWFSFLDRTTLYSWECGSRMQKFSTKWLCDTLRTWITPPKNLYILSTAVEKTIKILWNLLLNNLFIPTFDIEFSIKTVPSQSGHNVAVNWSFKCILNDSYMNQMEIVSVTSIYIANILVTLFTAVHRLLYVRIVILGNQGYYYQSYITNITKVITDVKCRPCCHVSCGV